MDMSTSVAVIPPPAPVPIVPLTEAERENLHELWEARKAANSRRAYASDWKQFQLWCFGSGLNPMPAAPETIARYRFTLGNQGAVYESRPHPQEPGRQHVGFQNRNGLVVYVGPAGHGGNECAE